MLCTDCISGKSGRKQKQFGRTCRTEDYVLYEVHAVHCRHKLGFAVKYQLHPFQTTTKKKREASHVESYETAGL